MTTRQKEVVAGKEKRGVSPISSSSAPAERRRSLRPSTPPGTTTTTKDHGKAAATSSATGEPRKHVPNYLRPTISSNPDVVKHTVKNQAHDDIHKPKPTPGMMRRRSFDKPVPAPQVQKVLQSSASSRGERSTAPFSPKHSPTPTRPGSSSDRVAKVVKAVKSQPPLLKTKSLPKATSSSGVKKEVKPSGLKKATTSKEETVPAPQVNESEAEDQESLDLNVEEELAKLESPVDPPPEQHFAEDNREHDDEENHSPTEHADEHDENVHSSDITGSEDHQDENEHTPDTATEDKENVEAGNEDTQAVHESQAMDENDQQSNQAVNDQAPAEDENKEEKEDDKEIKLDGLTVKSTPDEKEEVAQDEVQGQHNLEGGEEPPTSKGEDENEADQKAAEEEKPLNSEAENVVVHKRQVGGPRNKKESPAYNDVIEETASKLVEKRVNKVRALAGAFETVISLQQPNSS